MAGTSDHKLGWLIPTLFQTVIVTSPLGFVFSQRYSPMFYFIFRFILAIANLLFGVAVVATANEEAEGRGGIRNRYFDTMCAIIVAIMLGDLAVIIRSMVT